MGPVIRFRTEMFDIAKEQENPINPVFGESILIWLRENAKRLTDFTDVEPEDHGWYVFAKFGPQRYSFVGSVVHDVPPEEQEWYLVVERERTLKEKLFGKGKTGVDDPCFVYVRSLLEAEPGFTHIEVDA